MKNKKRIFIRIVSIIILSSLPIIYLMNELYFFSESNKRYTIGVYCKDGFIINSSTSREKGFVYYVDNVKHIATTSKYNNVNFSPTRTLIVFSCVFPGNAYVLTCTIPKWVLSPPKDGWKQSPPDINWKGAELDTAYMKKMDIAIPE